MVTALNFILFVTFEVNVLGRLHCKFDNYTIQNILTFIVNSSYIILIWSIGSIQVQYLYRVA